MTIALYISSGAIKMQRDQQFTRAMNIFKWHLGSDEEVMRGVDYWTSDYVICTYKEHKQYISGPHSEYIFRRALGKKFYLLFEDDVEFLEALRELAPTKPYQWQWKVENISGIQEPRGYEVTSKGDRRFSPFFMRIPDPQGKLEYITLEDYYQLYLKGYIEQGYTKGIDVKGLPPLHPEKMKGTAHQIFGNYIFLNYGLFYELALIGKDHVFTDMFDKNGGQNLTYCDTLNNYYCQLGFFEWKREN